jgi:hypothetical protein
MGTSPLSRKVKSLSCRTSKFDTWGPNLRLGGNRRPRQFSWLSTFTLLAINALFILLGTALLLVWHFNNVDGGFGLITTNHYSWTYGPTAILVCVVALWRQVDYRGKATQPWAILARGNVSPEQSVLLDYISPLQLVTFWSAVRNRHFLVVCTIVAFSLLKLIALASTGLFVVESTETHPSDSVIKAINAFNGSLFNVTEYVTKSDASIAYTAYGIMALGLSPGLGTTNNFAYSQFQSPPDSLPSPQTLRVRVDALIPSFSCQPANVEINPDPFHSGDTRTILMDSPSCELMGSAQPVLLLDVRSQTCPPRQLRGIITRVNCSMDVDVDPTPNRQLLTLVDAAYHQTFNNSNGPEAVATDIIFGTVVIKNVTSVLCRPS